MILSLLFTVLFAQDDGGYDGYSDGPGIYHPDDVAGPHSPDVAIFPDDPAPEYWVFRDGGVTVVNAKAGAVVARIDLPVNVTSEPDGQKHTLTPPTGNRAWGDSVEVASEHHIYINDRINEFVHIFDTTTRTHWKSVKLFGGRPVHMYYIPRLHEVWTHTDGTGAFDVIKADSGTIVHEQVQAKWDAPNGHGKLVFDDATFPHGYATTTNEGRVIKINLETREAVSTIDLVNGTRVCASTHYIGYSRASKRLLVQCSRPDNAKGTWEINVETEEIVAFFENMSGGIHVSPLAEEYYAINMGGTRQCAWPGYGPQLEDCADGELIYPDGSIDFFNVQNEGGSELHLNFAVNGGPSHVIWVPKENNPSYYWSVWAMVSSEFLQVFDMEKVHSGEVHEPGLVKVGMMKQEGHGSRYLDVGGGYIVAQANEDSAISVIDISDRDCLGKTGDDACPRSLIIDDSFGMARGIVYARPPGYLNNENNRDGAQPSISPSSDQPSFFPTSDIPSKTPSSQPAKILRLVAQVEGVTESNKDATCTSFGSALSGEVKHCSLTGASTGRRQLNAVPLYMDIQVSDLEASQAAVEAGDFTASLTLPDSVTVVSVDVSDSDGKDEDSDNKDEDSDAGLEAWVIILIVAAALVCLFSFLYVYKFGTVVIMQSEMDKETSGGEIPA